MAKPWNYRSRQVEDRTRQEYSAPAYRILPNGQRVKLEPRATTAQPHNTAGKRASA